MRKEERNRIIEIIVIIAATVFIVFAADYFLDKKEVEKEETEIKSVRIVDVNFLNTVVGKEVEACYSCITTYRECRLKSFKLAFQVDTTSKNISCKVYNNGEAEALGYSSAYAGMNVYPVFRDYSKSPQKYKVCCIYSYPKSNSPVCSEEYKYLNPC